MMKSPARWVLCGLDRRQQLLDTSIIMHGQHRRSTVSLLVGRAGAQNVCMVTLFKSPRPVYPSLSTLLSSRGGRSNGRNRCSSSVWKTLSTNASASDIQKDEEDIQKVELDIQDVEARLEAAALGDVREDVASLRKEETRLGEIERPLREEKRLLREKEIKVEEVQQELRKVEQEIDDEGKDLRKVEEKIDVLEKELGAAAPQNVAYLRLLRQEQRLGDGLNLLREKKIKVQERYNLFVTSAEKSGSLNLQPEHDPMERTEMKRPRGAHGGVVGKLDNGEHSWKPMECDRNAIDISQWVARSTQKIGLISKIMDEFGGGIPAEYYVREEEIMVFKCFLKKWDESCSKRRLLKLAIVGSPGVGKTTFIVLLAFFLVTWHNQRVLLLRKLKGDLRSYSVILLENGRYCGESVSNLDYVVREYFQPDTWYFIDGFTGDDVRQNHGALGGYSLLATSSQFVPKGDDPTRRILMPAWDFSDLAGLREKTEMPTEEINRRYYISGGSLRDFLRPEDEQRDIADTALMRVGSSSDAMQLLSDYGGATSGQIDTIRRAFLDDRTKVNQYMLSRHWKLVVDSGFISRSLLSRCSLEEYEKMYNLTRAIGGAPFGWASENLLQKKASSSGFCIKVQEYIDGKLCPNESWFIEIPDGVALGECTNKEECMASLKRFALGSSNYWYPDFTQFPTIDCVARGSKYSSDGKDLGEVVVYIQVTVSNSHSLDVSFLDEVDQIFSGGAKSRMYVAVLPKSDLSSFRLIIRGSQSTVRSYIGHLSARSGKKEG